MRTNNLDQIIADGVEKRDLPFCFAGVANRDGIMWQGAAGKAAENVEAGPDTIFRIFSMTKAIGSVAALIMVERGLLSMETPVADILPRFRNLKVLEEVGPDGPVYREPRTTCTLRHLLTHTSGFAYETFHDKMWDWHGHSTKDGEDVTILNGKLTGFDYPLMFDPGEQFAYGIGIDWAGFMVEAVDGRPIQQFCQEEIFDPLGMQSTFFEIDGNRERLAQIRSRMPDGGLEVISYEMPSKPEAYGMGHCLYSTGPDYLRFLQMVLNGGELDGQRILGPTGVRLMYENQMGDGRARALPTYCQPVSEPVDYFPGMPMTWTAAFLRNEEDVPGRRAAGSLTWSGVLNTQYWVDPASGIAGLLMTQLAPFCDAKFMETYRAFEEETYRQIGG